MSELIYIAAPYSHKDDSVRDERMIAVEKFCLHLVNQRIPIFSPLSHAKDIARQSTMCIEYGTDLGILHDYWVSQIDLKILHACSQLYVLCLDGWKESKGVQTEVAEALVCGRPVWYVNPITYLMWTVNQEEIDRHSDGNYQW